MNLLCFALVKTRWLVNNGWFYVGIVTTAMLLSVFLLHPLFQWGFSSTADQFLLFVPMHIKIDTNNLNGQFMSYLFLSYHQKLSAVSLNKDVLTTWRLLLPIYLGWKFLKAGAWKWFWSKVIFSIIMLTMLL